MTNNLPTMASGTTSHSTYTTDQLFDTSALFRSAQQPVVLHNISSPGVMAMVSRRVVQVFIADPNENIALDDCILFKGDVKVTDATDQELFFELDIKNLLDIHNQKRTKVIDKKVKDRTEYLEPAKVRDLKMVVVTVANL